jgi:anti-anti-sigma regulatory factor
MPSVAVLLKFNEEHVARALQQASEKLDSGNGEAVLDFSSVCRIDSAAVSAMEEFVGVAERRGVKLALRGVNVDVYKVLKLAKLAPRFSFLF